MTRLRSLDWYRVAVFACVLSACPASLASHIEAYTDDVSYVAGDVISFHVSTLAPTFDIEIIRDLWTPQVLDVATGIPGENHFSSWTEEAQLWLGANWPVSYTWIVPESWPTGSYLARFITNDGTESFRPFVIRAARPGEQSRVAFLTNFNTRNAYNVWGGASLYQYTFSEQLRTTHVSFHRPYTAKQGKGAVYTVAQPVANQLEADGFAPEYLAELDLHRNPSLIHAYDVIVLAGHHEYISKPIYDALEAFHARGGHLAFFSADDIWWQVRFEGDGFLMVAYKQTAVPDDPMYGVDNSLVTTRWGLDPVNRPGEALQGVSFLAVSLEYDSAPFLIQDASHWAFVGTGLQTGDPIGNNLARSETDYYAAASPPILDVLLSSQRYYSGTKPEYDPFIDTIATYYEDNPAYGFPNGRGGQVFSAGCSGWAIDLNPSKPGYQQLRIVTRNIIQHMVDAPMDCNTNGIEDLVELAACSASNNTACADCNGNSVPDECDLLNCPAGIPSCMDCNANSIPDGCDIDSCPPNDSGCDDCNNNGVPDECDIANCSASDPSCTDCDGNGVPDGCDPDCNTNGIADTCDIAACAAGDTSCDDCNANGIPDGCEPDCNTNGVADACDIAACPQSEPTCDDCNSNGVPDGCEQDFDGDTVIDPCDPDIDADGVPNAADICDLTPTGTPVRLDGSAQGDIDADCDVDLHDFAALQRCFKGEGVPVIDPSCTRARIDTDTDVDAADFALFEQTLSGP